MYSPKLFVKDWWVGVPLVFSLILQGFSWYYTLANIHPTKEQIFLHYNVVFGVDLVGAWWRMLFLPGGALLVILVNFIVSFFLYNRDKLLSRILTLVAIAVNTTVATAIYLIVSLNV